MFQVKPDIKAVQDTVMAKKLGMIAGWTGITLMLQLIRVIFKDKNYNSEISLLFANQVFVKIQQTNSKKNWSLVAKLPKYLTLAEQNKS